MKILGRIIVPLVGLVFLGVGGWLGWDAWTFVKIGKPAVGKVERFVESSSTSRRRGVTRERTTHYPVFSFKDAQGQGHLVTSSTGSGKPGYQVGQGIPVLYDPANPNSARINLFGELWLLPVAFGGIGCACLTLPILFRRRSP